jgi:hypothetical protein
VKPLFQQVTERYPAIDGQIHQDALLTPIAPDSEVFILHQIGGGTCIRRKPC